MHVYGDRMTAATKKYCKLNTCRYNEVLVHYITGDIVIIHHRSYCIYSKVFKLE